MSDLVAKINDALDELIDPSLYDSVTVADSVRAVLTLHPTVKADPDAPVGLASYWCAYCQLPDDVTCPTVRGVAAALGVCEDQPEGE